MILNDTINSKHVLDKINKETELNLKVKTNKFEVKQTDFLTGRTFKKGVNAPYELNGKFYVVKVSELIPAGPKELNEAKGMITSDYQTQLEKDWLEELTKKYPIKINESVLYNLNK
jgi:peptidyl-prolyl cis-trans isomerase SurA